MTVAKILSQAASSTKDDKTYVDDVFNTSIDSSSGYNSSRYIKTDVDLRDGGFIWAKGSYNYIHSPNMLGILGYDHGAGEYPNYGRAMRTTVNTNTPTVDIIYDPGDDIIFDYKKNGFTYTDTASLPVNKSVFHSFKKHKRFCDVVTYVGDNDPDRLIPHELEIEPGLIIIRRFDDFSSADSGVWYHGKFSNNGYDPNAGFVTGFSLASETQADYQNGDETTFGLPLHTASTFTPGNVRGDIGTSSTYFNTAGVPYIAILLAHDLEGPNGDDGLIAIGHYNGGGTQTSTAGTNLGWKPQYLFVKDYNRNGTNTYGIGVMDRTLGGFNHQFDISSSYYRGDGSSGPTIYSNLDAPHPHPDGIIHFGSSNNVTNTSGGKYLFIAVRDGPYREKELAKDLFAISTAYDVQSDSGNQPIFRSGFPVDLAFKFFSSLTPTTATFHSRDFQGYQSLISSGSDYIGGNLDQQAYNKFNYTDGWASGTTTGTSTADTTQYSAMWRKSPKFYTTVEYEGTGETQILSHNHGKAPDLIIHKSMTTDVARGGLYIAWSPLIGREKYLRFETDAAAANQISAGGPYLEYIDYATETEISIGNSFAVNRAGEPNQLLLFSSLENVSKIGKYYGNGTTLNINCGFTNHVRFLLIKRLDAIGDWIMTGYAEPGGLAQGFTADADYIYAEETTYRSLNGSSSRVLNHDWIRHYDGGFTLNTDAAESGPGGTGSPDVNADGGEYLYYAISY